MRHRRGPSQDIDSLENIGYAMGDAEDWLNEEEPRLYDLLDKLEAGKMTFAAARFAISLDFRAPRQEMNNWRKWWGWNADKTGLPYLDESLKQSVLKFPGIRVVLPLPGQEPA